MATLIPSSNVEAAYEDMFKEITRKLYGEETGNGLHTLGTPVAQVATTGPTAPEGERSFTNLQIDRSSAPTIEYENNTVAGTTTVVTTAAAATAAQNANVVIQQQPEGSVVVATAGGNFKSEDHLNTAFGLAALMQNGFTTTTAGNGGTDQQQQQQPQILQWTTPATGGKLQSYTAATQQQQQQQQQQQHQQQVGVVTTKSKSKNRNDNTTEVIYTSPPTGNNMNSAQTQQTTPTNSSVNTSAVGGVGGSSRKKSHHNQQNGSNANNNNNNNGGVQIQKRYPCTHCPYSTDRRDLYTRHENIHKEEKPFQCFACLKQFNRADHVKKHFMRMHRELQYDINKTRRHVPAGANSNGGNHHAGGRGNVTITAVNNNHSNNTNASCGSPEQKPNIIFQATNVQLDNAFLEAQRQPTSSSLSIAETIEAVATAADAPLPQLKQEKPDDVVGQIAGVMSGGNGNIVGGSSGNLKPKREKRFTCCYCPWAGADKWGLKRHLNTHTKPFVCLLCDYKAARSERLATHVLKVHNKRACNKCSFLGDTQEEFQAHINEVHHATHSVGGSSSTSSQAGGNGGGGGSVTIYTTTTTNDNVSGNITGGPLQEIIVNPTSMVGWRLSANGSLIPPHDLLTGALPNAAAQKRGSERLFQYLEADGSDPEDYARLLKMDAISRNTASVAQDFHKAGGVHELKIPANHQLLFNNKLPSQWTTKEAAALLQSLSSNTNFASYQQRLKYSNQHMRQRQYSTGEDDENTPSSASSSASSDDVSPTKLQRHSEHRGRQYVAASVTTATTSAAPIPPIVKSEQKKAMSAFLSENFDLQDTAAANAIEMLANNMNNSSSYKRKHQQLVNDENQENQEQLIKSPPAYNNKITSNTNNHIKTKSQHQRVNATNNNHRLDLQRDNKENNRNNATTFLTTMEYENLNKIGTEIQDYVKNIINKYYAETPVMYPAMPTATTTPHQSQELITPPAQSTYESQQPTHRKRLLSETEEYIEYLRNKEDITLTITPKTPTATTSTANKSTLSAASLVRQPDLPSLTKHRIATKRKSPSPKPNVVTPQTPPVTAQTALSAQLVPTFQQQEQPRGTRRKSLSQLVTLLPLLADAAAQQQYLTAPLDFSKKQQQQPTHETKVATDTAAAAASSSTISQFSTLTSVTGIKNGAKSTQPPACPPSAPIASSVVEPIGASNNAHDKRSSRKQAQPKKIRTPPEVVVAMLRDKYLNRMVDRKLSCRTCAEDQKTAMLVFNYHTKGTLTLHRHWKHCSKTHKCKQCKEIFKRRSSLFVHNRRVHNSSQRNRDPATAPQLGEK